jgi:hypothetical protein
MLVSNTGEKTATNRAGGELPEMFKNRWSLGSDTTETAQYGIAKMPSLVVLERAFLFRVLE